MRGKLLARNTFTSVLLQIVAVISGFILPRLIIQFYGSEVNGLVNSITQFLQIIAFLDLGVGAVVQSSLYEPLHNRNYQKISKIVASSSKFFRRIAVILIIYIIFLVFLYPLITKTEFSFGETSILIIALSASLFGQYFWGVSDRLLIIADQRGYIYYITQIVVLILDTAISALLIYLGASIQLVKIVASIIYFSRPIIIRLYVNKHYKIDRHIQYTGEPIKQKWNGLAQHIASVVLDSTDTIVLTVFSTLTNVSIYSVYNLAINGVKNLFMTMTNGIQSLLGDVWAGNNKTEIEKYFQWTEWIIHTIVVLAFGCAAVLIIPFVNVYTHGVNDAQYNQPLFAILIVLAHAFHCLRLPYHMMIKAAGMYKETQSNYIIASIINIVISIVAVFIWGLVGVAIGTLVAMSYQTFWMAWFNGRKLVKRNIKYFLKQIFVDAITFVCGFFITRLISLQDLTFVSWVILAIEVFVIWVVIIMIVNFLFYRNKEIELIRLIKNKLKK